MSGKKPLIQVEDLRVHFPVKDSAASTLFGSKRVLKAVDGVSFSIDRGEILSLVGESGSGKTTTGKAILQLAPVTGGTVLYDGRPVGKTFRELQAFRRRAQMIYQDPYQALNPRMYISDIVGEALDVNGLARSTEERTRRIAAALSNAGLTPPEDYLYRYPYALSGGQRQRVAIAGALVMEPEFVVADEPVSMLDASIRTGIIRLMLEQRERMGLAYLFITHDLSLAWLISDRIAIMYLGRIMEIGTADEILRHGVHPYTRALISIMPVPGQIRQGRRELLEGETPNAAAVVEGCRFASRCKYCTQRCRHEEPALRELSGGHLVACHLAEGTV